MSIRHILREHAERVSRFQFEEDFKDGKDEFLEILFEATSTGDYGELAGELACDYWDAVDSYGSHRVDEVFQPFIRALVAKFPKLADPLRKALCEWNPVENIIANLVPESPPSEEPAVEPDRKAQLKVLLAKFAQFDKGADLYEIDMIAETFPIVFDIARKHSKYEDIVEPLMICTHGRSEPDVDPAVYDEVLKPLIAHVLEDCPEARPLFEAELKEDYPDLAAVLFPPLETNGGGPTETSVPSSPTATGNVYGERPFHHPKELE